MDPPVKAGTLLVQQTPGLRLGAKRWRKSWCALFPASAHGVARLELFDCKEGSLGMGTDPRTATKRPEKKTLRLAECVSVAPAPDCAPKEGLAAFRLETSQRVYLLAAEAQEAAGWVARLCEIAFPQNPGQGSQLSANRAGEPPWEMATNSIYYSQDQVSEFWVTVQKTEAAERCGLQGRYLLKAPPDGLLLVDPCSGRTLYSWPYRLLRRYGRDKVMFSFEAGRRCESGPGNFTFETAQGNEIFRLVEAAIQSQKAQAEENRRSAASMDSASVEGPSALGHLHSALASSLSLDGEGQRREGGLPRSALVATASVTSSASVATEKGGEGPRAAPKGHALRDSAARCPLPRLPPSQEESSAASVYSEPLDTVRGSLPGPDPLYADPVDSRAQDAGRPPSPEGRFYEQVGRKGHIYDEPEGRGPQPLPAPSTATAIYDEARLPCEAWRTQGLESPAGYELPYLPGDGDYAVPAFQQKGRLAKAPKPCPVAKPPRGHRSPSKQKEGNHNNNSNNSGGGEPVYSQVRKPLRGARLPGQEEQSVDKSRPASAVYEDLGEI
ncbi:docking protein 1 isoform X2 [Anolis carolinensis]|uniref:docking protein 1 isoform X2 n=1 Tax=Anolis carolinensis TaxID=28377 RepID=UPI002F2B35EA